MAVQTKTATKDSAKTLLIADDEPNIRRILQAIFEKDGFKVIVAENAARALEAAASNTINVLITDLIMPDMNGIELLQKIKQQQPNTVIILITAYATIKTCVDAMRYGASDYITKPFDMDEMRAVVRRAITRAAESDQQTPATRRSAQSAVMEAPVSVVMQEVQSMVTRAAASKATVLIRGESGTGKELVARALHEQSQRGRDGKPLVAVSCAALSESLLDSELFGHEKNAFTGALTEKKGRFEMAHGGTLFLDEIGDISPAVQIKLLRVLQQREFERVGGSKTISVDVRLIAATNAALEDLIKEGKFREDLYYRLQVIQITLPPLRERTEDIPGLVHGFLGKFNRDNDKNLETVSPEAMELLTSYPWPGNVRELENIIERCVVLSDSGTTELSADLLPIVIKSGI